MNWKLLQGFDIVDKALDKIADGNIRIQAKTENNKNRFAMITKYSWAFGSLLILTTINFLAGFYFIEAYVNSDAFPYFLGTMLLFASITGAVKLKDMYAHYKYMKKL